MKLHAWIMILPIFWGCAGKNVVAGEDKTQAEKLAADLPSWCQQTCQRLEVCDNPDVCDCQGDDCECKGVGDDCVNDCQKGLNKFAQSESCAETGRAYLSCLDSLGCELLAAGSKPPCLPLASEIDACDEDDETEPAPTVPNGSGGTSSGDGSPAEGGSSDGPVPGAAAAPNTGPSVSCSDSSGSGGGTPDTSAGPYVTCQETLGNCSDTHEYSWICVDDAQGHGWCTCFLDGDPVGALAPALVCPTVPELNGACSWNLSTF
jgi:hypothetical protein